MFGAKATEEGEQFILVCNVVLGVFGGKEREFKEVAEEADGPHYRCGGFREGGRGISCGSGGGSIGGADVGVGHVGNNGSSQTFSKIIYDLNQKINLFLPSFLPCIKMLFMRFFSQVFSLSPSMTSKKKQMEFFYFLNDVSLNCTSKRCHCLVRQTVKNL